MDFYIYLHDLLNVLLRFMLQQLQDDIKKLGLRIKRHEDKIKSFTREENIICGHIQDLRGMLCC